MTLLAFRWRKTDLQLLVVAPWWEVCTAGICLFALVWKIGGRHARGILGVRHLPSHPPLWISGLIGTGAVMLSAAHFRAVRLSLGLLDEGLLAFRVMGLLCVGVAIAVVIVAAGTWFRRSPPKARVPLPIRSMEPSSFASFKELRQWLRDDQAVTSLSRDAFGHARIAERIALRLSEGDLRAPLVDLGAR